MEEGVKEEVKEDIQREENDSSMEIDFLKSYPEDMLVSDLPKEELDRLTKFISQKSFEVCLMRFVFNILTTFSGTVGTSVPFVQPIGCFHDGLSTHPWKYRHSS